MNHLAVKTWVRDQLHQTEHDEPMFVDVLY
jgi:hypothetical protein